MKLITGPYSPHDFIPGRYQTHTAVKEAGITRDRRFYAITVCCQSLGCQESGSDGGKYEPNFLLNILAINVIGFLVNFNKIQGPFSHKHVNATLVLTSCTSIVYQVLIVF